MLERLFSYFHIHYNNYLTVIFVLDSFLITTKNKLGLYLSYKVFFVLSISIFIIYNQRLKLPATIHTIIPNHKLAGSKISIAGRNSGCAR